jgi:SAM-dependent methyltransferase
MSWLIGFQRIPTEDWAKQPLEELAMKYDTVEEHGWYDNLDPTVSQICELCDSNSIVLDYSGGTGILTDRIMRQATANAPNVMIVDSSPKFLRLALEKLQNNPKVAYRLIRYIRDEKRLQSLPEVVDQDLYQNGIDVVVSTNAIHLYYDLLETVQSWREILKEGGVLLAQSGNIRNPSASKNSWIIDETVEHIHRASLEIIQEEEKYEFLRPVVAKVDYMDAHDRLRNKYFLPVKGLSYYTDCFKSAGFQIQDVQCTPINANVQQWYSFLEVYHEGVLGWVGGASKVTKNQASEEMIAIRKELMWKGMQRIFSGGESFEAVWTYITAKR